MKNAVDFVYALFKIDFKIKSVSKQFFYFVNLLNWVPRMHMMYELLVLAIGNRVSVNGTTLIKSESVTKV